MNAVTPALLAAMLQQATSKKDSPFDYIIVGSGAGGGPLACRLASAKKRVLLVEAGPDPKIAGEVHDAPLFHAASTEHPDLSWQFSVRHYANDSRQREDQKYDSAHDDPAGTGGILYPRSSGLGGCTSHHAMIVIRPNDSDWEHIADLTNDDSWRAKNMQPYFAKFEECLYLGKYRGFLAMMLGWLYQLWLAVVSFANPKQLLDQGGHGSRGWQPTSFISPQLIKKIIETDRELTTVLIQSAFKIVEKSHDLAAVVKRYLIQLGAVRGFDPNDLSTRADSADGGVFLIPTGIGDDNSKLKDESGASLKGRRAGLREFILNTQKQYPEYLVIAQGVHVTEVFFADDARLKVPQAIGVRGIQGNYLYKASPKCQAAGGRPVEFFVRHEERDDDKGAPVVRPAGEVILCGGAFNTPQLLLLSGIGDQQHIEEINRQSGGQPKITFRVHLPGVGRNLQDRYEVGVLSELKKTFLSLDTVAFKPGDPGDRVQAEWIKDREGLYATNGGTIAIVQRSQSARAANADPDLFTFGAPAAFRGYYWGWSTELLKAVKGGTTDQRNLWTWVILKAYTRNNGGTVRLRSANPFDTPKICFHSFDEGAVPDWEKDLDALVEAVTQVQAINGAEGSPFLTEIQPGRYLAEKNEQRRKSNLPPWTLRDWIKNEAWGHHACGTCRIGSDAWRKDAASLTDKGAVVDSHFHVHGVAGLRIVDASVFPKIPGYFILAPIFMVSEKAAATILTDHWEENYPGEVRAIEEAAIRARRDRALVDHKNRPVKPTNGPLPVAAAAVGAPPGPQPVEHIVGLALSGGGIRSATFSLGVLQALAEKGRLRHIDYLSTVSGGAFIGSFLGRLFTRNRVAGAADPCGRAQHILTDGRSGPLLWLRTQANYLFDAGRNDWLVALGVFFRNLFTVHLVVGVLLFAVFAILIGFSHLALYQQFVPPPPALLGGLPVPLSPWWWVPVAVAGAAILPMMLGFWLAPKPHSYRSVSPFPFLAWLVLLGGSAVALTRYRGTVYAGPVLASLALAWLWQEGARQFVPGKDGLAAEGHAARNRLSRSLGEALVVFVLALVWVVLDSLAGWTANLAHLPKMMAGLAVLSPLLQWFRSLAIKMFQGRASPSVSVILQIIAVVFALLLLYVIDYAAHCLFETTAAWEHFAFVIVALLFSVTVGPAFDFLNYSSLHAYYAAHVTRTFLGASNESRTTRNDPVAANVQTVLPDDDLPHFQYRPEQNGGPLHLISVCINETVDQASQREIRERKGLLMTISSFGVSVGRRYFATWTTPPDHPPCWMWLRLRIEGMLGATPQPPALLAVRLNADPGTFHPLARRDQQPAIVKTLSLGDWVGISGAAFSTGRGRDTLPLNALFMGLLNLRLGYWWHSGIQAGERPGRYPPNLWLRLKQLPETFFHMQSLLLSEWRGRFDGPSRELWNLTDGGEQDNSAIYELIRRRVPFIIAVDAGEDPDYTFADFANLQRLVRVDFGVEIEWQANPQNPDVPGFVQEWIKTTQVGSINGIKGNRTQGGPGTTHAALARIIYQACPQQADGWLLLIKPSLTGTESLDVTQYAAEHPAFPQDSTFDQVYDDEQWESYRKLGHTAGMAVLR